MVAVQSMPLTLPVLRFITFHPHHCQEPSLLRNSQQVSNCCPLVDQMLYNKLLTKLGDF